MYELFLSPGGANDHGLNWDRMAVKTVSAPSRRVVDRWLHRTGLREIVATFGDLHEDPRSYIAMPDVTIHAPCKDIPKAWRHPGIINRVFVVPWRVRDGFKDDVNKLYFLVADDSVTTLAVLVDAWHDAARRGVPAPAPPPATVSASVSLVRLQEAMRQALAAGISPEGVARMAGIDVREEQRRLLAENTPGVPPDPRPAASPAGAADVIRDLGLTPDDLLEMLNHSGSVSAQPVRRRTQPPPPSNAPDDLDRPLIFEE